MINFVVLGPIVVDVAELVTIRLGGSAVTFGGLQAAYGIGALAGVWIASRLKGVRRLRIDCCCFLKIMVDLTIN